MRTLTLVVGLALVAGGCDHGPTKAEQSALDAVGANARGKGVAELFPAAPKTRSCSIRLGGPVPGRLIRGTCETRVTLESDGSASVRFRESWDRNDFHAQPGSSRRRTQTHSWTFAVSKNGRVIGTTERGDVPPQYIP